MMNQNREIDAILGHDWRFSKYVESQAASMLKNHRANLTPEGESKLLWWVGSANNPARWYLVQLVVQFHSSPTSDDEVVTIWASCSCSHGMNNQGHARCYHVASVVGMLDRFSKGHDS